VAPQADAGQDGHLLTTLTQQEGKFIARGYVSTEAPAEKAFLVGLQLKRDRSGWEVEDSLEELERLATTANLSVVGQTYQKLDHIDPATYIGKGKLEEIQVWLAELEFDLLVFDDELSPRQCHGQC